MLIEPFYAEPLDIPVETEDEHFTFEPEKLCWAAVLAQGITDAALGCADALEWLFDDDCLEVGSFRWITEEVLQWENIDALRKCALNCRGKDVLRIFRSHYIKFKRGKS